jgi:hypothetical protein
MDAVLRNTYLQHQKFGRAKHYMCELCPEVRINPASNNLVDHKTIKLFA